MSNLQIIIAAILTTLVIAGAVVLGALGALNGDAVVTTILGVVGTVLAWLKQSPINAS